MSTYGQEILETVGSGIQVLADGEPSAKSGGITVLWSAVPASTVDATYESDVEVEIGDKFMRYGTILCRIEGGASAGMFAPYGTTVGGGMTIPDATGLSTARGDVYILNESVFDTDYASDHPAVIDGGRVYMERLQVENYGVTPTDFTELPEATFIAAFPNVTLVREASS